MTVYWWIAAGLVAACFVVSGLAFVGYVWSGDDRARNVALAWGRWGVVFTLAAFNIALFKHLIVSLLS